MKKMNKKGFTLAELLIVVAIIAVLVAIAIPVFTAQLEKSKLATEEANARSTYGEAVASYLTQEDASTTFTMDKTYGDIKYTASTGDGGSTWTVTQDSTKANSGVMTHTYP